MIIWAALAELMHMPPYLSTQCLDIVAAKTLMHIHQHQGQYLPNPPR